MFKWISAIQEEPKTHKTNVYKFDDKFDNIKYRHKLQNNFSQSINCLNLSFTNNITKSFKPNYDIKLVNNNDNNIIKKFGIDVKTKTLNQDANDLENNYNSILIYILFGSCIIGTYFGIKHILRKN